MQATQGTTGRIFVLRLEDGDRLPDCVEDFAANNDVKRAFCSMLGGVGPGALIVGPEDGDKMPPDPMRLPLSGVYEAACVGTLFPDESGKAKLHMHGAMGRAGQTITGCVRAGVDVWQIGEVVIIEIVGIEACRRVDPKTGFELLELE